MHKVFCIIFLCAAWQFTFSQNHLRLEITVPPASKYDSIFIAGSFNNWDPHNRSFYLSPVKDKLVFEKNDIPNGIYEFKFTRGSWDKVETTENGSDIQNRLLKLSSDTTLQYSVASWKDFKQVTKSHTVSNNVHILDTSFRMKMLDRSRRIWIYLPPGYKTSTKRYPVLYMHDGQNLFDAASTGYGEWGVDEILDSLTHNGKAASIVVGIDNGPRRMNEYNPYYFERTGEGEGERYLDFIIKDLKPNIDKRFRTLPSKENTIIAGSSMGALISYYAVLKYPSVFGKAGIFSPAFWTAPPIYSFTDSLASRAGGMFFFYIGELEGEAMLKNMNKVTSQLGKLSNALLYTVIDPSGRHNEEAWRKWFAEFYLWVTSNGLNHIIK